METGVTLLVEEKFQRGPGNWQCYVDSCRVRCYACSCALSLVPCIFFTRLLPVYNIDKGYVFLYNIYIYYIIIFYIVCIMTFCVTTIIYYIIINSAYIIYLFGLQKKIKKISPKVLLSLVLLAMLLKCFSNSYGDRRSQSQIFFKTFSSII